MSVHNWGGGGYPGQVQMGAGGGTPARCRQGVPQSGPALDREGDTPSLDWGDIPIQAWTGGTPIQSWTGGRGVPHHWKRGTPIQSWTGGGLPHLGYPFPPSRGYPPVQDNRWSMPLAFTQEDFLVVVNFWGKREVAVQRKLWGCFISQNNSRPLKPGLTYLYTEA